MKKKRSFNEKDPAFRTEEVPPETGPQHRLTIRELHGDLKAFLKQRARSTNDRWDDYEQEDADADFAFKNAEALHAFILPASRLGDFDDYLGNKNIQKDILQLFRRCYRNTETPTPRLDFSPGVFLSPETSDGLVDFAALALRVFCFLSKKALLPKGLLQTQVDDFISTTTSAILDNAIHRPGKLAWSPSIFPKGIKHIGKPDTYFTACVALALYEAAQTKIRPLKDTHERCSDAITKACYWLQDRFDGNRVFSDEEKGASSIIYFTYALQALLTCWDNLDDGSQLSVTNMSKAYLILLKDEPNKAPKCYHTFSVSDNKSPLAYEDRSALGNVLTVLSLIKHRIGADLDFDQVELTRQLGIVYARLMSDKNEDTGLWSGTGYTIYTTNRAIEGLTYHAAYVRGPLRGLSEGDILGAVMQALNSKVVRNAIMNSLIRRYEELSAKELESALRSKTE